MRPVFQAVVLLASAVLLLGAGTARWHWRLPPDVQAPPVPADNAMSAIKVELGRRLFYDADLSANGTMACAACHEQKRGFADGNATRPGVHGDPGRRNVPGLANVAWRPVLTWGDPRVTTLEAQAIIPLLGERPVEMGMKALEAELPRRLGRDACYVRMFARAFPGRMGRIDTGTVSAALAAFQRTMIALDSPWDRYRAGEMDALSPLARQGAAQFAALGCTACHGGRDLTDDRYHAVRGRDPHDEGLAEASGLASDAGRFRTPSLRNVAVTGPWLHDGTAKSLAAAIARHGAILSEDASPALLAFLESLTDAAFLTDPRYAMPDRACGRRL
ncbi:cytochrome-c peroxidase [Sphingomonas sp. VDB2]|uniref:cytochrome-c peroxidase n=1 Tax=Sphingomonas sp. VDB2 TaxID=3228751 RepID=UPI003A802D90